MEFLFFEKLQEKYYEEIKLLLTEADNEFVPPLSARTSTTQNILSETYKNADGVLAYFNELKKQKFLLAICEDELCGFVSYIENYENSVINHLPNVYISTVIVAKEKRGNGLTIAMYKKLFNECKNNCIFTRTWSTNASHIKILSSFGFEVLKIIKDDRGAGIDTIYFQKKNNNFEIIAK